MNINNQFIKKIKIVATTGPTFENEEMMESMFKRGVNTIRLNMSHGDFEEHGARINNARSVSKKLNLPISILLDTKGPEIRIHKFANKKVKVPYGKELEIHTKEEILGDENKFSVSYQDLTSIVEKGQTILCDDGKLTLEVSSVDKATGIIKAVSQNNHFLSNNKAVNVPGVKLTLPFVSEHDLNCIEWGLTQNIDYIAASFVSDASDVEQIRDILKKHNKEDVQIVSKIESLQAVEHLNEIISASDGIMLARGDLGVEIPYQQVPFYEKLIISKCRVFGKPVIVATQMLDSMMDNPRPTRAEVTDVYYAGISGTDATMLSGESAQGNFPKDSVEVMSKINYEAEMNFEYQRAYEEAYTYVSSKNAETSYAVAKKALENNVQYIFAFSTQGRLVKALSKFRPKALIVGLVESERLSTAFGIWYGVYMKQLQESIETTYQNDTKIKAIANEMGIKDQEIIVTTSKQFRLIRV